MKQTVIFFAILIALFLYWFMGTITNIIDDTDVSYGVNEKALVTGSKNIVASKNTTSFNAKGEEIILLNGVSLAEKKRLWNNSDLKVEMLKLFPKFIAIKDFINEHVEDDGDFKKLLLEHVENVESQYIGAALSAEKAKKELSSF